MKGHPAMPARKASLCIYAREATLCLSADLRGAHHQQRLVAVEGEALRVVSHVQQAGPAPRAETKRPLVMLLRYSLKMCMVNAAAQAIIAAAAHLPPVCRLARRGAMALLAGTLRTNSLTLQSGAAAWGSQSWRHAPESVCLLELVAQLLGNFLGEAILGAVQHSDWGSVRGHSLPAGGSASYCRGSAVARWLRRAAQVGLEAGGAQLCAASRRLVVLEVALKVGGPRRAARRAAPGAPGQQPQGGGNTHHRRASQEQPPGGVMQALHAADTVPAADQRCRGCDCRLLSAVGSDQARGAMPAFKRGRISASRHIFKPAR